jgi:hypothetical protein
VRSGRKAEELARLPGVEIVIGDMLRPDSLGAALDGVDRALMISSSEAAMLETQCRFVDAAKRVGVRQALLANGMSTYVADALDEQAEERRRCPESRVDLSTPTHSAFGRRALVNSRAFTLRLLPTRRYR